MPLVFHGMILCEAAQLGGADNASTALRICQAYSLRAAAGAGGSPPTRCGLQFGVSEHGLRGAGLGL